MIVQQVPFWEFLTDLVGLGLCGAALFWVMFQGVRRRRAAAEKRKTDGGAFADGLRRQTGLLLAGAADPMTPPASGADDGNGRPATAALQDPEAAPLSRFDAVARLSGRGLDIQEISDRLKIPREEIGLFLSCTAGREQTPVHGPAVH